MTRRLQNGQHKLTTTTISKTIQLDYKSLTCPEHDIYTELHIIIGHDRTHLSFDALDQDNMTCLVTAFTYSRSL